ncbi:acid protease [Aaosphaeria arxii CBS 175.79]|uniref:Acid protease n=1 Tax=Aaosphaeria arxii CBS 175.79 TaxID=1450172 RepID=A0A6A5XQE5_9PLEO|nr:acid protease [Aaosphaeria arxii CBS 175.79]KAF2014524.1 acid protease [Aaosphaeria arxii CBS 175.79]
MASSTPLMRILIWVGVFTLQALAFSRNRTSRQAPPVVSDDQQLVKRIKRQDISKDVILHPFSGRGLPYFTDLLFPAPCGQPTAGMKISIDTGSSDFWIDSRKWCKCPVKDAVDKQLCTSLNSLKKKGGVTIEYDDNSKVTGAFLEEDLFFGKEETLEGVTMMAAWGFEPEAKFQGNNAPTGVVGLSFIRNQQVQNQQKYWTLPYVLENNAITSSNAFSMWFEETKDHDDFEGKIFFGGYVTNYYKGALTTFPLLNGASLKVPTEIVIQLDGIKYKGKDTFYNCKDSLPVLLDTGTYSSFVPIDIFKTLVDQIGPNEIHENSVRVYAVFDCKRLDLEETVDFQIGKLKVPVPLKDLIREVTQEEIDDRKSPWLKKGKCTTHAINAFPSAESRAITNGFQGQMRPVDRNDRHILGVTFLRRLIVLYDLPQGEVALGLADQVAMKKVKPKLYSFDDVKRHQGQGPYNPVQGVEEVCRRA